VEGIDKCLEDLKESSKVANDKKDLFTTHCQQEAMNYLQNVSPETHKIMSEHPFDYEIMAPPADLSPERTLQAQPITGENGTVYWGEQKPLGRNPMIAEGKGIIVTPEGDVFQGWFKENVLQGFGRHISALGEVYSGPFVDGRRHGQDGVFKDAEGGNYKGEF
jgi:hypothetical protein